MLLYRASLVPFCHEHCSSRSRLHMPYAVAGLGSSAFKFRCLKFPSLSGQIQTFKKGTCPRMLFYSNRNRANPWYSGSRPISIGRAAGFKTFCNFFFCRPGQGETGITSPIFNNESLDREGCTTTKADGMETRPGVPTFYYGLSAGPVRFPGRLCRYSSGNAD